jgi:hypothetical protein
MTRRIRRGSQIPPFPIKAAGCDAASDCKPIALSLSPSPSRSRCNRNNLWSTALVAVIASLLFAEMLACGGGGASADTSTGTSGGTGLAPLSGFNCTSGAMTGAGTDNCTVALNAAAGTGGQAVNLSSNATAVTVPSSVSVAAGATSASFTATIAAVSTAGTATLTASSGGATLSYAISLGVTGQPIQPAVSALNCTNGSMTGAGSDPCTVTLNEAAGAGGQAVSLSSNATAVTVPLSVTVAQGATSAGFTATVSAVSTAETATLTASLGGGTETYAISLSATGQPVPTPTLSLQSTSVGFGDVDENTPAYQSVTLTSSGTAAVTVSAGTVSGTGYTISGVSFPSTLNPGATATLQIEFDPTTTGLADGTVTLTSNSSSGTTATIGLTGTGVALSYEVNLTWDAPTSSPDPVAGYNVFRAVSGSSTYQLVNSTVNNSTSYSDTSVANSTSYTYYVVSVDAEGNQSVPSNTFTVSIP